MRQKVMARCNKTEPTRKVIKFGGFQMEMNIMNEMAEKILSQQEFNYIGSYRSWQTVLNFILLQ